MDCEKCIHKYVCYQLKDDLDEMASMFCEEMHGTCDNCYRVIFEKNGKLRCSLKNKAYVGNTCIEWQQMEQTKEAENDF